MEGTQARCGPHSTSRPADAEFCAQVDASWQRLPSSRPTREVFTALTQMVRTTLQSPWWVLDAVLTGTFGALAAALEGLIGLRAKLEITQGLHLSLLGEHPAGADAAVMISASLPPLSATIAPTPASASADGISRAAVAIELGGQIALSSPGPCFGLGARVVNTGIDARQLRDAETIQNALVERQSCLQVELEAAQAATRKLERDLFSARGALDPRLGRDTEHAQQSVRQRLGVIVRGRSRAPGKTALGGCCIVS